MSRSVSDSGSTATPRLSASARAIISSAVRSRASQDAAAGQPSSSMINSGAARSVVASGGFHSGPAAAMMTRAAKVSRSSVSHQGVRDGVSSFGRDLEQQARRRKIDSARARRHQPQQPPQHRQTEQAEQHQRLRKPKRQVIRSCSARWVSRGVPGAIDGRSACCRPCANVARAEVRLPADRCGGLRSSIPADRCRSE